MTPLERLRFASNEIRNKLSLEGYYEKCPCRSCDALRPLANAKEEIDQAISEMVLGSIPSPESEAQERSKAVAPNTRTLAVARRIAESSTRYELWVNGRCAYVGWSADLIQYCHENQFDLTFV